MTESPYWNPRTETMSRDDLHALQLAKLRRVAQWAQERSPHYRSSFAAAGFRSDQLRSLADLARLPVLTRDEWMRGQASRPPYGTLPAEPAGRLAVAGGPLAGPGDPRATGSSATGSSAAADHAAIRLHTTSGTTGREPLRALDSRKDWAWAAEMWCYGMWAMGIRPTDRAYLAFGYGSFIGFWGLHYGLEKLGALVIPGGAQPTDRRVRQIAGFGVSAVASTPTYALRLAQEASVLGIDLTSTAVRTVVLSGEPSGSVPQTKALIEREWGASAYDTAGMTEISTIFMFECARQPGGAHIIEDHLIEEVIDPATGMPAGYGELGERVVTSFGRSMIPLIRYRTGDLVVKVPHTRCGCGRTFDIYEGGVLGRADDMRLVRGTNVYPRAVESIVRGHREIDEFQIRIVREGLRDEIYLRVEIAGARPDPGWPALAAVLHRELADAHEGLNFKVELAEPGSLPRFELKARRLVDDRKADAPTAGGPHAPTAGGPHGPAGPPPPAAG